MAVILEEQTKVVSAVSLHPFLFCFVVKTDQQRPVEGTGGEARQGTLVSELSRGKVLYKVWLAQPLRQDTAGACGTS